jgi:hypothetical protein
MNLLHQRYNLSGPCTKYTDEIFIVDGRMSNTLPIEFDRAILSHGSSSKVPPGLSEELPAQPLSRSERRPLDQPAKHLLLQAKQGIPEQGS